MTFKRAVPVPLPLLKDKSMKKIISSAMVCALLCGAAFSANAAGFGDALKDKMGSGSSSGSSSALSALGLSSSGTASNAAGVITYCMKNNYLNADKAAQVKDQLLGKIGLGQKEEPKDEGYLGGLSGVIKKKKKNKISN